MMVVTVYTAQFHIPAVDLEHLADDLHLLHTQVVVEVLDDGALGIVQLDAEGVEVRLLCRP